MSLIIPSEMLLSGRVRAGGTATRPCARKRCRFTTCFDDAAAVQTHLRHAVQRRTIACSAGIVWRQVEIEDQNPTPHTYCTVSVLTARSLGKGLQLLCGCGANNVAQEGVARGMSSTPTNMPAANMAVYSKVWAWPLSKCKASAAVLRAMPCGCLCVCTWRRTEPAGDGAA